MRKGTKSYFVTDAERDEIVADYKTGRLTHMEIAVRRGRSLKTVGKIIAAYESAKLEAQA